MLFIKAVGYCFFCIRGVHSCWSGLLHQVDAESVQNDGLRLQVAVQVPAEFEQNLIKWFLSPQWRKICTVYNKPAQIEGISWEKNWFKSSGDDGKRVYKPELVLDEEELDVGEVGAGADAGQVGGEELLDELAQALTASCVALLNGVRQASENELDRERRRHHHRQADRQGLLKTEIWLSRLWCNFRKLGCLVLQHCSALDLWQAGRLFGSCFGPMGPVLWCFLRIVAIFGRQHSIHQPNAAKNSTRIQLQCRSRFSTEKKSLFSKKKGLVTKSKASVRKTWKVKWTHPFQVTRMHCVHFNEFGKFDDVFIGAVGQKNLHSFLQRHSQCREV